MRGRPWRRMRESAALAFAGAFGEGVAAITPGDRSHDEETEASAFDLASRGILTPVKAIKDAFHLGPRYADTAICTRSENRVNVWREHINNDVLFLAGIFDGVVKQIEDRGAKFFGIAHHDHFVG